MKTITVILKEDYEFSEVTTLGGLVVTKRQPVVLDGHRAKFVVEHPTKVPSYLRFEEHDERPEVEATSTPVQPEAVIGPNDQVEVVNSNDADAKAAADAKGKKG